MLRKSRVSLLILLSIVITACGGESTSTTTGNNAQPGLTPGAPATFLPDASATRSAQLSELQKTVQARGQADAEWQSAAEGETIGAGGGAKTGDEARVKIDITDGTILRLAPNTEFKLEALSPQPTDPVTKFSLAAGKVWTMVTGLGNGSFEIEAPAGVATVRGSFMGTAYFPAAEHFIVTCLEGACRLAGQSGRFTDLVTGQQSEIRGIGNDPSPAQPIDPAELRDWGANFPEALQYVALVTPGPTSTPTPPSPVGGGQTACDHPYFPLRSGATWNYSTESGPTIWTVGNVSGDANSATAEITFAFGSGQVTWHFQCNTDGIASYDFGVISSGELGQFAVLNVTSASGVFLPAAELLVPGYTWNNDYTTEIEFGVGDQTASGTSARSDQFSVTGAEPVAVGGQTFDGLQLSRSGTSSTQVVVQGVSAPPIQMSDSGTLALARGVGIVQTTSQTEGFSSHSELLSYSVP
ncbi:MAG TPA: FecR family protein [Anaerolineales bacterium]|nr:FecR family protein [Anaerolineales bacterium]